MLTDTACRNASCPADKPRARFADANGLYLEVAPNGSKRWFWKYRFAGKEKRLSLGVYPTVRQPRVGGERAMRLLIVLVVTASISVHAHPAARNDTVVMQGNRSGWQTVATQPGVRVRAEFSYNDRNHGDHIAAVGREISREVGQGMGIRF